VKYVRLTVLNYYWTYTLNNKSRGVA